LKDYYLYRSLNTLVDIQTLSKEADKIRREGKYAYELKLQECVSKCIDIGYTSRAEKILEKELGITLDNLKESPLFVDKHDGKYNDKLRVLCGLGLNHLYSDRYDKAKRYFKELRVVLEKSLEVGNKYFELNRQLTRLEVLRKEEGRKEIEQKIKKIWQSNEVLPFYEWFWDSSLDWKTRLQYDFIDLLNKETKLRSRNDEISDILSEIINKCDDMKECLEIPFNDDIYKGSDKIVVRSFRHGSFRVETHRKIDAEKKLKEILKAFDGLVDFCGKESVRQLYR